MSPVVMSTHANSLESLPSRASALSANATEVIGKRGEIVS
jgi:hypothetical protein